MVANTTTCKTALSQPATFKTDPTSDGRSPHPTAAGRTSRCVSVPFATVPTFTRRPHLSKELDEKLGKAHGTGLAHAVAVIGLGGTGKTQLVLRYIEEHEEDYDTVFWIDVRSEETARSSYERCCRELGLPIESATGDVPRDGHNILNIAIILILTIYCITQQYRVQLYNNNNEPTNIL